MAATAFSFSRAPSLVRAPSVPPVEWQGSGDLDQGSEVRDVVWTLLQLGSPKLMASPGPRRPRLAKGFTPTPVRQCPGLGALLGSLGKTINKKRIRAGCHTCVRGSKASVLRLTWHCESSVCWIHAARSTREGETEA